MAAIAILIIIVLLFTFFCIERTFYIGARDLHISVVFTLLGALVGIIVAAFLTTCIAYWYKRYRETALRMHGWKILAVDNEDAITSVASNTNNAYVSSHECAPVISPSPAYSCQGGSHSTKKISTIVDHTESKHITETTLIMNELQHKKTQRHHTRIDFTSGSTLNKAQENPISVTVTHNPFENVALHRDNGSSGTPSQLESYC